MAYSFTTTNYFEDNGWSAVTAAPFTIAAWFYWPTDTNDDDCIFQFGDSTTSNNYFRMSARGDLGEALDYRINDGSGLVTQSVGAITQAAWQHACFIETSSTSHRGILNGNWAGSATNATDRTPTINSLCIGYENDSSPGDNFEGNIAEVAVWNATLNQFEVEALAAGYSALFIRPGNLVSYFPMIRGIEDRMGVSTMTATGSPSVTAHPPIIYPSPLFQGFAAAGEPPEPAAIPIFMRHYRNMRT